MGANFAYQNTRDFEFILQEWLPTDKIFSYEQFAGYYSKDEVKSIFEPILKLCKEVIEPVNEAGITNPSSFVNGKVISPPGMGDLFHRLQEEGWGTSNINEEKDAMILPHILYAMIWEMMGAANPSLTPYIELTDGAANLIQTFGDEKLKDMFLPKMMDGSWSGTMCLTEPSAGSDVGDILSKAYPTDDPRIFKIKGTKIFITGGDNDFTDNIIHLYLARVEGAKAGTSGISLFVVPKYWVNEDGSLEENDVETTGIEHKMGLLGSITASLSFGDNNNCRGWLLGINPLTNDGKGNGMAQMFQMMNLARLETGLSALSMLCNGYYNARDYCKERIQGRPFSDPKGARLPLINHEDIKRTLLMGKAHMEAMRAMIYKTFFAFDVRHYDPDPETKAKASNLVEIATPLCKAYNSDEAWWLLGEAIQTYGGYGYMNEYPISQIARDVKIYSIWEGTNFIQSLDLVGRKWGLGKGQAFEEFLQEIRDFCKNNANNETFSKEFAILEKALAAYVTIKSNMQEFQKQGRSEMIPLFSRRILTATAQLYAGSLILEQALIADKRAKELGPDHYDHDFYSGKVASAKYYLCNVVPNVISLAGIVESADTSAIDIPVGAFDY
ncbi:MAG: acyl-CoA dehydrogenase [Syntrophomonadaceae bacterium]|jgi:alkylation response protein AidB-like acyl-CoA dehydrogenase|nr:acyl-CoA dehydrogenase [Syntrophomonadaceae bacterium]